MYLDLSKPYNVRVLDSICFVTTLFQSFSDFCLQNFTFLFLVLRISEQYPLVDDFLFFLAVCLTLCEYSKGKFSVYHCLCVPGYFSVSPQCRLK